MYSKKGMLQIREATHQHTLEVRKGSTWRKHTPLATNQKQTEWNGVMAWAGNTGSMGTGRGQVQSLLATASVCHWRGACGGRCNSGGDEGVQAAREECGMEVWL